MFISVFAKGSQFGKLNFYTVKKHLALVRVFTSSFTIIFAVPMHSCLEIQSRIRFCVRQLLVRQLWVLHWPDRLLLETSIGILAQAPQVA